MTWLKTLYNSLTKVRMKISKFTVLQMQKSKQSCMVNTCSTTTKKGTDISFAPISNIILWKFQKNF